MMIKRILILIFLSSLITKAHAYECEFAKLKPGPSKNLEEINIFSYDSSTSNEPFSLIINGEAVCKNKYEDGDELRNIMSLDIHLTFVGDKLIKVNYINNFSESAILFDILNNDYKIKFKRNQQEVEKKQSEFFNTTLNDNSYFYVLLKNKDRQQEYLEISNDKHIEKLEKHLLGIEETQ